MLHTVDHSKRSAIIRTAVGSQELSQLAREASQVQSILLQFKSDAEEGQELLLENAALVRATLLNQGLPGCLSGQEVRQITATL